MNPGTFSLIEKRVQTFKLEGKVHVRRSKFSDMILFIPYESYGKNRVTELRHKFRKISLTSAHVILLHYAEVNIPIELGADVNIRCRSPQVGAEIISCRSYSCRTSIAPYGEVTGVQFEVKQVSKCVWLLLMVPCLDSIFPDSILTYSKERFIFLDVMHFYAELILKPFKARVSDGISGPFLKFLSFFWAKIMQF